MATKKSTKSEKIMKKAPAAVAVNAGSASVTVKKPVVKKFVPKKSRLKKATPEVSFYLADGRVCTDLEELAQAIDDITDEVFYHHVSDFHNDFANWVEHIFDEKNLAETLRSSKCKDRQVIEIFKVVVKKK